MMKRVGKYIIKLLWIVYGLTRLSCIYPNPKLSKLLLFVMILYQTKYLCMRIPMTHINLYKLTKSAEFFHFFYNILTNITIL